MFFQESIIKITYKSSGVNTKNASKLVNKLEKITKKNFRPEIIQNPGGFCSLFDLKKLRYRDPILLSSTDGVGTKLKVALEFDKLNYLGIDLVAMCVNDILANGGEPLFFLKPETAIQPKNHPFFIPEFSNKIEYEIELVLRINKTGKHIEENIY